jgi:hypothetical protein
MSKARIIGAGAAGSLGYNTNVNLNTAGGSKKQGSPITLGSPTYNKKGINRRATGPNRNVIFFINQVGGANRTNHFNGGGVHRSLPYTFVPPLHPNPLPSKTLFLRVRAAVNEPGPGAFTLTFTADLATGKTVISGFNRFDITQIAVVHMRYQDNEFLDYFLPATYENGTLVCPVASQNPVLTFSVDLSYENQDLSNTLVQLNVGSLLSYVEEPYFVIVTPSPLQCPHFNITLPVDFLEQETCTAFILRIENTGTTYKYYYTPSRTLTSYPQYYETPAACSLVC